MASSSKGGGVANVALPLVFVAILCLLVGLPSGPSWRRFFSIDELGAGESEDLTSEEMSVQDAQAIFEQLRQQQRRLAAQIGRIEEIMLGMEGRADDAAQFTLEKELGRLKTSLAAASAEVYSLRHLPEPKKEKKEKKDAAASRRSSENKTDAKEQAKDAEKTVRACKRVRTGCHSVQTRDACLSSVDGSMASRSGGRRVRGEPCVWCDGICFDDKDGVPVDAVLCAPEDWLLRGEGTIFGTFKAKDSFIVANCLKPGGDLSNTSSMPTADSPPNYRSDITKRSEYSLLRRGMGNMVNHMVDGLADGFRVGYMRR
eukprot:TRINITY_DN5011_c0_g2_i1.p1 TRINITY_DN5011_c0_g2~~TRINITY_DN5011_c0_g2_i1.p1  ORF type:complete len:315 (-),score=62.39 TRINITY_DN5011_c0_g2_i1:1270-2214(-)